MLIRVKNQEFDATKLRDQYTVVYYNTKGKRFTASTWDVEVYCKTLESWLPFEKAYGEAIFSKPGSYELYEREVQMEGADS